MDRQADLNIRPELCFEVWLPVVQIERGEEVAPEFAVVSQEFAMPLRGELSE